MVRICRSRVTITIQGSVQAVAAALGVPGSSQLVEQGLGPEFFNPATYTAADCPTYQGESGPNCPHAAASAPADGGTGHTASNGVNGVMTTPATQQAAVKIATGLFGRQDASFAGCRHAVAATGAPAVGQGAVSRQPIPWRTLAKLAVFVAVAVLATVIVTASLLNLSSEPQTGYTAAVHQRVRVSSPGDFVDIAGVQVGTVTGVQLQGRLALVNFTADSDQSLTTTTHADVDYANLLGQQLIALVPGRLPGRPLAAGCADPSVADRAGTRPDRHLQRLPAAVRRAAPPQQVNELTASIIQIFQGESGNISSLVTQTASITENLAQRQQLIGQVIDNLSAVAGTLDSHDQQLVTMIDQFDGLVTGLANERGQIGTTD